jgi:hypothetical protein
MKGGEPRSRETLTPAQSAEVNSRVIPPTANEVKIDVSATGIGPRWSNFADRLRERRKEVVSSCVACGQEPSSFGEKDKKAS